ncbi:MAG: ATP-dependent zinc metalloprotease FtsH [Bacilli bacterium]|nr:ATP-dependent zinc metalloprotease FtsH [Bacilli bacterium]
MGNNRRRSIWSYIIPYLLVAILVGGIVSLLVTRFINPTVGWRESQLDSYVYWSGNKDTDHEGKYYIQTYSETQSYTVTTVNGVAREKANPKNAVRYTFIVNAERWNNPFNVGVDELGNPINHESYSSIFISATAEWQKNAALVEQYGESRIDNGNPYEVSFWDAWGPTIISTGITLLLLLFLFTRLSGSIGGSNRQALDFNKSPARREDSSKVRFADVAGCDEEKEEMVELVGYLKNPKKYSQFGARLPKGVLLIGPPGTGKTLLAKAVAGEAGVPFYSISGSDFVEMFVGVGAGRVRDLFKKAKQTAPCIIFIDEIDAVGRQRGAGLGGGNDEREQTLNQLLVEMDGFDYNAGILVIAATNRDDVLDPALLRPGRFDRIVTVSTPDAAGREAIFKVHSKNKKLDPNIDFKALSKRTIGFSGADIENIMNEAAILAVRTGKDSIGITEIDEAIDRRIAGPAKSGKRMNPIERKEVAYHEAGHAVIGLVLPHSEKVQKITIIPRGNTGGHVLMTPEDDRFIATKKQLLAEITGLLGGRTSEEIFFDDISTGAQNDIEKATRIARLMVTEWGMSDLGPIQYERDSGSVFLGRDYTNVQKNFSNQVADEIDKEVRKIIEEAHEQAKEILLKHKNDVILIAETLLEKETITAEEIESLIKDGKLPTKEAAETKEIIPEDKPEEK